MVQDDRGFTQRNFGLVIDDVAGVEAWLKEGGLEPATFQGVDLSPYDAAFSTGSVARCVFLGCTIGNALADLVHQTRAGLVSELGLLPPSLQSFRTGIYTVADLYKGMAADGSDWENTPDHEGFVWFNEKKNTPRVLDLAHTVAARLHDTVQERASRAFLHDRKVIAIMGGHDFKREPTKEDVAAGKADVYWECVSIAKQLTETGFLILTGGGPGLMEAGNLGALLAGSSDQDVAETRSLLKNHPFDSKEWRATGMVARERILGAWHAQPDSTRFSLGIPTWFYGHEPPNLFASHHSKMFYNSLREDGLVTLANSGIIYFEGSGGTVQEIFQDAAQNYYVGEGQSPTPMVFYNPGGYWDRCCRDISRPTDSPMDKRKPLLPLVRQLAAEKKFTSSVFVTQNPGEAVGFLVNASSTASARTADVRLGNAIAVG
jgi:predicted Rossmann-fold nucleotide-binding protein